MRDHINDNENGDLNKFEVFFQPIADVYLGQSMQMQFFMKFGNADDRRITVEVSRWKKDVSPK